MLDPQTRAEIARRNGALSKGPKTEAGKARSSKNAIRHGLSATRTTVLQNENPLTWERVLGAHIDRYRPSDDIESELVEDIAFCRWRLRRFRSVDTALWDLQMEDQAAAFAAQYAHTDESARLAHAFRHDANIRLAGRYESNLRRAYDRAVRNWKDYRNNAGGENKKLQNEPSLHPGI